MENNCKNNEQISQQSKNEFAFAFAERMVKRLWIALIATVAFLFFYQCGMDLGLVSVILRLM